MPQKATPIIAPDDIDPVYMLHLFTLLLDLERDINRLEHDRINLLGNGDPILSDDELCRMKR